MFFITTAEILNITTKVTLKPSIVTVLSALSFKLGSSMSRNAE